ncbi:MAG TPA: chromate transporter [Bacillota bacterium]|nr:chromate transporter [Bacillota bacterium]HOB87227.1 chromate transporter [Bacillota bacterium]HOP68341.1 chromate transporter [Bacillota bacterium]HPT33490.1 chromate transporter [Bacillota bacterium]HPZ65125.1 chromate transporter [Bacillota bacterium]
MPEERAKPEAETRISLLAIFLVFLKIGAFTFGGGYAMLPIIQEELVRRRRWVDQDTFIDNLVIIQSLPGAMALNKSILTGIKLRGPWGGVVAALGVVAAPVLVILLLAGLLLPLFREHAAVQAAFYGLRPAVVALILSATLDLGREIVRGWRAVVLVLFLMLLSLFFQPHPILIILAGGLAGLLIYRKGEEEKE